MDADRLHDLSEQYRVLIEQVDERLRLLRPILDEMKSTLDSVPSDHPDRPVFEQQYEDLEAEYRLYKDRTG